ncbi:MAG: hypothetical protein KAJ49_02385 [Arcobacteraceae bacterium]|nr:hypothetical protein [Arcobacteraceae bacterium]
MTINSSYNNLPSINDLQSNSLEKIGSALAINSAADNASGLAIADALDVQKNSLSQSIENMTSGIAMGSIAMSGISSQKDILENIRTETLKAMNGTTSQEGKEAISNQIGKLIEQFDNISNSTTYNGTTLLTTQEDISDDLTIIGEDSTINMQKADTSTISDDLKSFLGDFSTSRTAMGELLNAVDKGIDELNNYASDFASATNAMESNVRNNITMETNIASARGNIMDVDYSKEVTSFSKSNLLSQIGIIVQSQANATQGRNLALLT